MNGDDHADARQAGLVAGAGGPPESKALTDSELALLDIAVSMAESDGDQLVTITTAELRRIIAELRVHRAAVTPIADAPLVDAIFEEDEDVDAIFEDDEDVCR